jgi:hypothetical protein
MQNVHGKIRNTAHKENGDHISLRKIIHAFQKEVDRLVNFISKHVVGFYGYLIHTLLVFLFAYPLAYLLFPEIKAHYSFHEQVDVFLSRLFVLSMLIITFEYTVLFLIQKWQKHRQQAYGQKPSILRKGIQDPFGEAARVFFCSAAAILLADAGLKISLQLLPLNNKGVEPLVIVDVLILSIIAVMLVSLHEFMKPFILTTRQKLQKEQQLEGKHMRFLFFVLFATSVLIAGLCVIKKVYL